jgi:hypothetical protein
MTPKSSPTPTACSGWGCPSLGLFGQNSPRLSRRGVSGVLPGDSRSFTPTHAWPLGRQRFPLATVDSVGEVGGKGRDERPVFFCRCYRSILAFRLCLCMREKLLFYTLTLHLDFVFVWHLDFVFVFVWERLCLRKKIKIKILKSKKVFL